MVTLTYSISKLWQKHKVFAAKAAVRGVLTKSTTEAVITNNAGIGIVWDGDFDRCFLFDKTDGVSLEFAG